MKDLFRYRWMAPLALVASLLAVAFTFSERLPAPRTLTTFDGPALNPASVVPGDSIWMPMRVFSPDGNSQTVVQWPFNMQNASTADRVYFYVHKPAYHPSLWAEGGTTDWQETGIHPDDVYDEKVSFRFSRDGSSWSPWDSLTVERADCSPFARDGSYDCVTGPLGQLSLRVTVELSPHTAFLQDGLNYIEMRLNNPSCTDSPCSTPAESQQFMATDGYRLLEFEIWDSSRNDLITTTRTWDDPQQWLNPIPNTDQTNVDAGKLAWETPDINVGFSGEPVSCQDCHAPGGFDMRFAAVHPGVIYLNAIETGKTSQEAHDITSYIWSNHEDVDHNIPTYDYDGDGNVTAQETDPIVCPPTSTGADKGLSGARPWNPWLQPGQLEGGRDLTSIPPECWPAGAGLAGVLDNDAEAYEHAVSQYEAGLTDANEYMSQADFPRSILWPDWAQWIPDDAPAAIFGRSVWESTTPDAFSDGSARASEHLMTNVLPGLIDTEAEVNSLVSNTNIGGQFQGGIMAEFGNNSLRAQNFTQIDNVVFEQYIQEGGASAPDCSSKPGSNPSQDGNCLFNSIEHRVMGNSVGARQAMLLWYNATRYKVYDLGDEIFQPSTNPDGKKQYMGDFFVPTNEMTIYAMADHMRSRWVDAGSLPTGLGVKYFSNVWYLAAEAWVPGSAGRSLAVDPNYVGALMRDAQTATFPQHMTAWASNIFFLQYMRTHNIWNTGLNQNIGDRFKSRSVFYGPSNGMFARASTTDVYGYNAYGLEDSPDEQEAFIHNSLLESWNTHVRRYPYSQWEECGSPGGARNRDDCFGSQATTPADEGTWGNRFIAPGNTANRFHSTMGTMLESNVIEKGTRPTLFDSTASWVEHWYPLIDWSPYQCASNGGALDCSQVVSNLPAAIQRARGAIGTVQSLTNSWRLRAGAGQAGNRGARFGISDPSRETVPDGTACDFRVASMQRVDASTGSPTGNPTDYHDTATVCEDGDVCVRIYAQGRSASFENVATGQVAGTMIGTVTLPADVAVTCDGSTCSASVDGASFGATLPDPGEGVCAADAVLGSDQTDVRLEVEVQPMN